MQSQQIEFEIMKADMTAEFEAVSKSLEGVSAEITRLVASEDLMDGSGLNQKREEFERMAEKLKDAKSALE
jgi:hypothetical protein